MAGSLPARPRPLGFKLPDFWCWPTSDRKKGVLPKPQRGQETGQDEEGSQQSAAPSSAWTSEGAAAKALQSCPTLCDPTDCSPPGSSIHGNFQARVPEWGAIAFSE